MICSWALSQHLHIRLVCVKHLLASNLRARIHVCCFEQGNGTGPDHLVLNHLPFAEDLRMAKFTSFEDKSEYLPTEEQVQSMKDLVQSLDLKSGIMKISHNTTQRKNFDALVSSESAEWCA